MRFFILSVGLILSLHSAAGSGGMSIKSRAALADAKKMILYNGCIWAAGGGVTRYDIAAGKAKQYVIERGLVANAVFDASVDGKNHVLWAATSSGLGRLDLETGRWQSFGRTGGLHDPFVLSLCIYHREGDTLLFIGTRTDGLYFLREGSDKITRAVDKEKLPDPWISSMALDTSRNYLWIGTASGVVRCKTAHPPLKIEPLPAHNRISAKRLVVDDRTGDVFCLNYYNEIFRCKFSTKKWEKIPSPLHGDIKTADLVLDCAADRLWTATNRGIHCFKLKQKQWTVLPGHRDRREDVSCMVLDPRNHVLYYTARQGIRAAHLKEKKSRLVLANSPPFNNTVNTIFIDEKNHTTWIGTDWGIARFERKNRQWKFFHLPLYPEERVLALSVDDNTVWFGTMYHGPGKMDRKTGIIEEIKGTPGNSTVTSIIGDPNVKKTWFGLLGTRGGVYEYDMRKKELRTLPFLDNLSVTSLLEDGDWIWVGTGRGVAKFHKLKGPCANPFEPRLAFADVLTLALDTGRNLLWITTEYQVIVYDRIQKQHKIFKCADGFPRSPVTSILCDGERTWLGTEGYGLYMYKAPGMGTVNNSLTRVEGTADRYIISLARDKKQGQLWVGTVSGGISIVSDAF